MVDKVDWKSANLDVVQFVFEQADKYLSAQLAVGIAADQRATSAAATFAGFSGAILAGSLGYYVAKPDFSILSGGVISGFVFLIAAACCFYSARPVAFNFAGNEPENWYASLSDPLGESIGMESENYSEAIAENAEILRNNGRWLAAGFIAASLAPILGVAAYVAVILWCRD